MCCATGKKNWAWIYQENEMGHRYYTDREVRLFTQVRDLKEKGFQLKAIKMILSTISEDMPSDNIISLDKVRKGYSDEPHMEASYMKEQCTAEPCTAEMNETKIPEKEDITEREEITEASKLPEMPEGSQALSARENSEVAAVSAEDKMKHFKYIMDGIMMQALKKNNQVLEEQVTGRVIKEMDYLFRLQEEKDEERFRNLDDAIRKKQKGRKEAAAARIPSGAGPKRKKRFFHKKDPF